MLSPRSTSGPTTLDLQARGRIAEIGSILAAGLQRLQARKSSTLVDETGESPLHNSAGESGHEPHVLQAGEVS
jgi:hypothetical protein